MNERNIPTERRIAAVELLLSLGYTWDGKAWNTRPTAVASHAEGEVVAWRVVADAAIWDLLNDDERDVMYFDKNDVPTGEEAEGFTITPLYTHPPRSGDEARDAARWRAARDNQGDGLRLIMWDHRAMEELQVMFPSKSLCDEYADAAMAAGG